MNEIIQDRTNIPVTSIPILSLNYPCTLSIYSIDAIGRTVYSCPYDDSWNWELCDYVSSLGIGNIKKK